MAVLTIRVRTFLFMMMILLVAFVLTGTFSLYHFKAENKNYQYERLERKEKAIASHVDYITKAYQGQGLSPTQWKIVLGDRMDEIGSIHKLDIGLYHPNGVLLSRSHVFEASDDLFPTWIDLKTLTRAPKSAYSIEAIEGYSKQGALPAGAGWPRAVSRSLFGRGMARIAVGAGAGGFGLCIQGGRKQFRLLDLCGAVCGAHLGQAEPVFGRAAHQCAFPAQTHIASGQLLSHRPDHRIFPGIGYPVGPRSGLFSRAAYGRAFRPDAGGLVGLFAAEHLNRAGAVGTLVHGVALSRRSVVELDDWPRRPPPRPHCRDNDYKED